MKFKKLISSSLALGLLINSTSTSLASILSEDGRYETFEGNNITIDNILEEDKVDVEVKGNTMVNVANQKDPVPITKAYTIEGTNHIPLQGEYDGKARPIIEGKTISLKLLPSVLHIKTLISLQSDGTLNVSFKEWDIYLPFL